MIDNIVATKTSSFLAEKNREFHHATITELALNSGIDPTIFNSLLEYSCTQNCHLSYRIGNMAELFKDSLAKSCGLKSKSISVISEPHKAILNSYIPAIESLKKLNSTFIEPEVKYDIEKITLKRNLLEIFMLQHIYTLTRTSITSSIYELKYTIVDSNLRFFIDLKDIINGIDGHCTKLDEYKDYYGNLAAAIKFRDLNITDTQSIINNIFEYVTENLKLIAKFPGKIDELILSDLIFDYELPIYFATTKDEINSKQQLKLVKIFGNNSIPYTGDIDPEFMSVPIALYQNIVNNITSDINPLELFASIDATTFDNAKILIERTKILFKFLIRNLPENSTDKPTWAKQLMRIPNKDYTKDIQIKLLFDYTLFKDFNTKPINVALFSGIINPLEFLNNGLNNFVYPGSYKPFQHGCETSNPNPNSNPNNSVIHFIDGIAFITNSELERIQLFSDPEFVTQQYQPIHKNSDINMWAPVIEAQLQHNIHSMLLIQDNTFHRKRGNPGILDNYFRTFPEKLPQYQKIYRLQEYFKSIAEYPLIIKERGSPLSDDSCATETLTELTSIATGSNQTISISSGTTRADSQVTVYSQLSDSMPTDCGTPDNSSPSNNSSKYYYPEQQSLDILLKDDFMQLVSYGKNNNFDRIACYKPPSSTQPLNLPNQVPITPKSSASSASSMSSTDLLFTNLLKSPKPSTYDHLPKSSHKLSYSDSSDTKSTNSSNTTVPKKRPQNILTISSRHGSSIDSSSAKYALSTASSSSELSLNNFKYAWDNDSEEKIIGMSGNKLKKIRSQHNPSNG